MYWTDMTRVLVVDDDPVFIGRAREALEQLSRVRVVTSGAEALSTVPIWRPDVVVFDLLMNDLDGFTFLEELSLTSSEVAPFVLYTTDGRGADTRIRPLTCWQVGTVLRSSDVEQLRSAVIQALRWQKRLANRSMSL
jgi:CheY-like chemotaxis protein